MKRGNFIRGSVNLFYESIVAMITPYMPYTVTEAFCVFFSVMLLLRLKKSLGSEKEILTLRIMFAINIILLLMDILWALTEDDILHPSVIVNLSFNAVADMSVSLGCYFWFRFTDQRLHYPFSGNRTVAILMQIPVIVICVLDIITIFTGWFFYIDGNNHYMETDALYIQGAVNCFYLVIPTAFSIIRFVKYRRGEYLIYALYILGPVFCMLFEDVFPTIPVLALIVFTALLIMFLAIYVDREKEILEKKRELAETHAAILEKEQELTQSRVAIMLSQIQPHFLYNSLTAIQTLCHGKAPEAEESIVQFADFLRGNLDSLSQKDAIPFQKELTHTQNYLNLETRRFGEDTLHVEYNIEAKDFRIPALTLQPVVENAVRYGVMQREEGGTVWISSVETDEAFVVTVKDDGVGFDVSIPKADGRTHIGISNVRGRLEKMCDGSLTIESVPDKGTTSVITIPKKEPVYLE